MEHKIEAGGLTVAADGRTGRLCFAWRGRALAQTEEAPVLRLAGEDVKVTHAERQGGGVRFLLAGDQVSGSWRLAPADGAIASILDIDGAIGSQQVEVEIPFPLSAAIELPTDQMRGWRFDSSWPEGREEGVDLSSTKNQIAAVEVGAAALAFIGTADYTRRMPQSVACVWRVGAHRRDGCLWLRIAQPNGVPMLISAHDDLDGVNSVFITAGFAGDDLSLPDEGDVRTGVVYADGSRTGTYHATHNHQISFHEHEVTFS